MNLIVWLLHLSEGIGKYNIRCTACINQNIVDQNPLMTQEMTIASL
jgi:cytochrome c-type biogenesis protein CcmH/NrfF